MSVDFSRTARDYAQYRAGFPDALFDRLAEHGVGAAGQRLLDLGTGTGTLARGFARRGCVVTGLDRSAALMAEAKALDRDSGVTVDYVVAAAEETGFGRGVFDVVSAGQCWHWFDREAAAHEARRVLVRGGALVVAHFDWIPLPGNVAEATEKLIERHNPKWAFGGGTGVYPAWLRDAGCAGFRGVETFTFDVAVPYLHEAWRGRIRASAGVGATLSAEQVVRFDADLARLLAERFPEDPLEIPHRVFALICRSPG
jgi:SAM-dependent methyltransferase